MTQPSLSLDRTANLLGAFALALCDRLRDVTDTLGDGAQAAALVQIGSCPDEPIHLLSRTLGLSHSGTVRVVAGLEAAGWVAKGKKPGADGRLVTLHLTPEGEARKADILTARAALLARLIAPLDAAGQAALTSLLEQMFPVIIGSLAESDQACRLCDLSVCPEESCPATCDDA